MRERHQALSARCVDGDVSPLEREYIVHDIVQAGAQVPPGPDRDSLRNMLFYWTGEQSSRGERDRAMRAPSLLAFNPVAPLDSSSDVPLTAPTSSFAAPTASPDTDPDAEARRIVRIAALAREWRLSEQSNRTGYLIGDKATLAEAARYVDRDPDIRSLVEASGQAVTVFETRTRNVKRVVLSLAFIALVSLLATTYLVLSRARAEIAALHEAGNQRAKERGETRDQAAGALEALRHDDLTKLRQFLAKQSDADPAVLARLEIRKANSQEQASDAAPAPLGAFAPPAPLPAPTAANLAPSCPGFLWFGSKGSDSLIEGQTDPAALKPGNVVKLDSSIRGVRLRATLPLPGYVMGKQIGIVPAGAIVTVTGEIKSYDRGNATQIFAPVSVPRAFCTTVFLQYVGPQERRDDVLTELRALQVQAPPGERIDTAAKLAEVRYFWIDDKPIAEQVAARLARCNAMIPLTVAALTNFSTKPSQGTIEVWLDLTKQGCSTPTP